VLEIVSVRDFRPGERPTVVFRVSDRAGPITSLASPAKAYDDTATPSPVPRKLASLAITFGGPAAPDFALRAEGPTVLAPVTETVPLALAADANGDFSYTFTRPVPADATGAWIVGIEAQRPNAYAPAPPHYDTVTKTFRWPYTGETVVEAADNAVAWVDASTGTIREGPSPRRAIVDLAKCNRCHGRLIFHGNRRTDIDLCAACHTPERTDWEMRPKDAGHAVELSRTYDGVEERSIHLKVLVHRIHTGGRFGMAELSAIRPFVVYGYGQNARFRDRGGYPQDLADCRVCHLEGTWNVEAIPAGAAPTVANESASVRHHDTELHAPDEATLAPISAACLGCHANGHAVFHTARYGAASGKETCSSCHGAKGSYAVEKLHGIPLTE
jgi:OmcA/MtrC family decaheme c-type cytochrome